MDNPSDATAFAPKVKAPESMTAVEKAAWEQDMAAWKEAGLPLDVIALLETLRSNSVTELDLKSKGMGVPGAIVRAGGSAALGDGSDEPQVRHSVPSVAQSVSSR